MSKKTITIYKHDMISLNITTAVESADRLIKRETAEIAQLFELTDEELFQVEHEIKRVLTDNFLKGSVL